MYEIVHRVWMGLGGGYFRVEQIGLRCLRAYFEGSSFSEDERGIQLMDLNQSKTYKYQSRYRFIIPTLALMLLISTSKCESLSLRFVATLLIYSFLLAYSFSLSTSSFNFYSFSYFSMVLAEMSLLIRFSLIRLIDSWQCPMEVFDFIFYPECDSAFLDSSFREQLSFLLCFLILLRKSLRQLFPMFLTYSSDFLMIGLIAVSYYISFFFFSSILMEIDSLRYWTQSDCLEIFYQRARFFCYSLTRSCIFYYYRI